MFVTRSAKQTCVFRKSFNPVGNTFSAPVRQVSFDDEPVAISYTEKMEPKSFASKGRNSRAIVLPMECTSYWYTDEAARTFHPMDWESSPEEAIENMIALLELAIADGQSGNACLEVLDGHDRYGLLSLNEKQKVFTKAAYVLSALKIAKETIDRGSLLKFGSICEQAACTRPCGCLDFSASAGAIWNWFREFRQGRVFANPKEELFRELYPLLRFFADNPVEHKAFMYHVTEHLDYLSPSYAYNYFCASILRSASEDRAYHANEFPWRVMNDYGLDRMTFGTFRSWLNLKGFVEEYPSHCHVAVWKYSGLWTCD